MAADPILAMANNLLDCLEGQFPTPGSMEFCLRAGEEISEDVDPFTNEDLCCTGLGWVRVGSAFPSSNFPEPDGALKRHGCFPTGWAQELEVGILRCYVPGGQATIPTCAQHNTASINDSLDVNRIKCAISCWVETLPKGRLYSIAGITVSGPRTNCISRIGSVLVASPGCCDIDV